ncbi:hypothetical protein [Prosthecomicrobium hirschii]|uniref:hypothetical protein n=1 Tax=Prosthecodimorpha hirschii TaxID=665126 RepID=UPI00221F22BB|nr:hypothetical protein [Prosthecomicrobium hirschii]MCW1840155.1 hypothetical protein [Prosthecomicrobium hirschii]
MANGLERYGNVRGGGFVELRPDANSVQGETRIKQKGDRPFFGKFVTAFKSLSSRHSTTEKQANRAVRQDLLDNLAKADRGVAARYADRLVGGNKESKPLSARLVRQIMAEVGQNKDNWNAAAKTEGPGRKKAVAEQRDGMVQGRFDWLATVATRFPGRVDDFRETLAEAVDSAMKTGKMTRDEAITHVAKNLADRLQDEPPLPGFVTFAGDKPTVPEIEASIRGNLAAYEKTLPQFPVDIAPTQDPLVLVLHDPEAKPEKSILKQTGPITPGEIPNKSIAEYTQFRSDAENAILDGLDDPTKPLVIPGISGILPSIEDMAPQSLKDAIDHHNRMVGDDGDTISLSDLLGHPGMDIYGRCFNRLKELHEKAGNDDIPSREEVEKLISGAVQKELDNGPVKGIATHILANPNLSPKERQVLLAEVMDRNSKLYQHGHNIGPIPIGKYVQNYLDQAVRD